MKLIKWSIVDDEELVHFIVKKLMKDTKLNIEPTSFFNGEEILDFLKQNLNSPANLPDIIFLDLNMPLMNGWEFLAAFEELKPEIDKNIVIYILSSSKNERDLARFKSFPFVTDYLVKPIKGEFIHDCYQLLQ